MSKKEKLVSKILMLSIERADTLQLVQHQRMDLKHQAEELMVLEGRNENLQSLADRQGVIMHEQNEEIEKLERHAEWLALHNKMHRTMAFKHRPGFNDVDTCNRMENVCRLASAALSHITAEINEVDIDDDGHLYSAVALLKPLSTGVHDTYFDDNLELK